MFIHIIQQRAQVHSPVDSTKRDVLVIKERIRRKLNIVIPAEENGLSTSFSFHVKFKVTDYILIKF